MESKVNVKIAGASYTVTTDESKEYVAKLAGYVDGKMREILAQNDRASVTMAAVMTAFALRDEACKSEKAADNLRVQIKDYLSEIAKLREESEENRREISKLLSEISVLKQRLSSR